MRLADGHQSDLFGFAADEPGSRRNPFANLVKALSKVNSGLNRLAIRKIGSQTERRQQNPFIGRAKRPPPASTCPFPSDAGFQFHVIV